MGSEMCIRDRLENNASQHLLQPCNSEGCVWVRQRGRLFSSMALFWTNNCSIWTFLSSMKSVWAGCGCDSNWSTISSTKDRRWKRFFELSGHGNQERIVICSCIAVLTIELTSLWLLLREWACLLHFWTCGSGHDRIDLFWSYQIWRHLDWP